MIRIGTIAVAALMLSSPAFADIVEVRGKGMMTGTVLAENGNEVSFVTSDGKELRFAKSDVLFIEREDASGGAKSGPAAKKDWMAPVRKFFGNARYWFSDLSKWSKKQTRSFRDIAGKPLDRSGVNGKSDQLAKVMDEAAKAQGELARKRKKINEEIKRQQDAASGAESDDNSGFNGTFGKL